MSEEECIKMFSEIIKCINDIIETTPDNLIDVKKDFTNACISIETLLDLYKKKSRMVEIMAEHLTTDLHRKDWVIKYFENEVELEKGEK